MVMGYSYRIQRKKFFYILCYFEERSLRRIFKMHYGKTVFQGPNYKIMWRMNGRNTMQSWPVSPCGGQAWAGINSGQYQVTAADVHPFRRLDIYWRDGDKKKGMIWGPLAPRRADILPLISVHNLGLWAARVVTPGIPAPCNQVTHETNSRDSWADYFMWFMSRRIHIIREQTTSQIHVVLQQTNSKDSWVNEFTWLLNRQMYVLHEQKTSRDFLSRRILMSHERTNSRYSLAEEFIRLKSRRFRRKLYWVIP